MDDDRQATIVVKPIRQSALDAVQLACAVCLFWCRGKERSLFGAHGFGARQQITLAQIHRFGLTPINAADSGGGWG